MIVVILTLNHQVVLDGYQRLNSPILIMRSLLIDAENKVFAHEKQLTEGYHSHHYE